MRLKGATVARLTVPAASRSRSASTPYLSRGSSHCAFSRSDIVCVASSREERIERRGPDERDVVLGAEFCPVCGARLPIYSDDRLNVCPCSLQLMVVIENL